MGQYTVQISDMDGNACNIRLSLPLAKNWTSPKNSTWRVLDEGYLKFRSGGCGLQFVGGITGTANLYMVVVAKQGYGIKLNDFLDTLGMANDSGDGSLAQPWVTGMKPGAIGWALV